MYMTCTLSKRMSNITSYYSIDFTFFVVRMPKKEKLMKSRSICQKSRTFHRKQVCYKSYLIVLKKREIIIWSQSFFDEESKNKSPVVGSVLLGWLIKAWPSSASLDTVYILGQCSEALSFHRFQNVFNRPKFLRPEQRSKCV